MNPKVAVIVGSLRKASWSRKLAQEILRRAQRKLQCSIVEIGDLPLYNEDLDDHPPASWTRFRSSIDEADAVLFVTPEYNRSIPGALKNALDVGSRPEGQNHWAGKPAAVVSQTPYLLGAFGANHALRQTFVYLDVPVMQQPEAYIGTIGGKFDAQGHLTDPETGQRLDAFIVAFANWIARLKRVAAPDHLANFMKRREEIATAYVNGDCGPLDTIVTHLDPATFMSPGGDFVSGAAPVASRYAKDAAMFGAGSESQLEILQSGSGQLAFWTGIQHARVRLQGKSEPVGMDLRVTEVFRLEDGAWKLVHRHADRSTPQG